MVKPLSSEIPLRVADRTRRRFSAHVAWTLATRIVMLASGVCTSIIVARWLGAEGLGALAVLNVTVAVALQIGCAGLPSANTYFIARDRSYLAPVWTNALLFAAVAGVLVSLFIIALAKLRPALFGNVPFELVAVAAVSIPFQLITLLGLNVFLGLNRIAHFNLLDSVTQALMLLNAVCVLIIFGAGLWLLVSVNVLISLLACLVIIWLIGREVKETGGGKALRPDAGLFKEMARYGIKFHISVLAGILLFRADLLLVNHFRGATEAGVYAVAAQVASMLMVLPSILGTLIFPRITAVTSDERGEYAMRATRHTAFVMLLVMLLVTPLVFLLPIFYGPAFADASVQLLILLPGVYLLGIEAVLVQYFSSTGIPAAVPLFWLITLVINVSLNLIFVPTFGARAAAAASSVSYALIFVFILSYFRARTGHTLSQTLLIGGGELRKLLALARR